MASMIEAVKPEEYAHLWERQASVDPEMVSYFEKKKIGDMIRVKPDVADTPRKTKRRVNAAARVTGKGIQWKEDNGYLIGKLIALEDVPEAPEATPIAK